MKTRGTYLFDNFRFVDRIVSIHQPLNRSVPENPNSLGEEDCPKDCRSDWVSNVRNPVATATDRDPCDTRNGKPALLDKFLLNQLLTGLLPVRMFCVISMRVEDECR